MCAWGAVVRMGGSSGRWKMFEREAIERISMIESGIVVGLEGAFCVGSSPRVPEWNK